MPKSVTSVEIVLHGRMSFSHLDSPQPPKPNPDGTPSKAKSKFNLAILMDPSSEIGAKNIAQLKSEAKRIAMQFWDGKIPNSLQFCFGEGNKLDKVFNGYKDMYYLRASNESRVPVVGRQKQPNGKFQLLDPGSPEWPADGYWINAKITLWTQDSHGRKGINANLLSVQFVRKDEIFGSNKTGDPDQDFQSLGGDGVDPAAAEYDPFQ